MAANPISAEVSAIETQINNNTNLSSVQKLQALAAATATQTASAPLLNNISGLLSQTAALRFKLETNTATLADKTAYATLRNSISTATQQLQNIGQLNANELAIAQQAILSQKLVRLQPSTAPGTISYTTFTTWLNYIFGTQALNPYSRERACDIEFLDILQNNAADQNNETAYLNQLSSILSNTLSS